MRRQFEKHPDLGIETEGKRISDKIELKLENNGAVIQVRGPFELPERTTIDKPLNATLLNGDAPVFRQRPVETSRTIWDAFVAYWGASCWYCGVATQNDRRTLHLDHIQPQDGTNDDCYNRALACAPCNSDKSDNLTVEESIDKALEAGRIATPALRDEVLAGFETRRQWAAERWESINPS